MNSLEKRILDISYRKKLAHIGSSLCAVNIIDHIYSIKKPDEKFVLSQGHAGLSLYVVLEKYGFGDAEKFFEKSGVHATRMEHINCSTGSLGHGLPVALGMALADRTKRVFCLVSDGECMEGSIWETLRLIEETKATNLHVFFNINGWGGYKAINTHSLYSKLNAYHVKKTIVFTQIPQMPGLEAHYVVLDRKTYEKLIRN